MARVVLGVLAILVAQALGEVIPKSVVPPKVVDNVILQRQIELSNLFNRIGDPVQSLELKSIVESFDWEKNIEHYSNVTAVKEFIYLLEHDILQPRWFSFSLSEPAVRREAEIAFNLLYSAKDYSSFYKAAVYLRQHLNEAIFVYVLSVAILYHPETQGVVVPPVYEIFPSYFHNAEIINLANKINVHGKESVKNYPQSYMWDENVVIRWNETVWPYAGQESAPMSYFMNDYSLNAIIYNNHLRQPFWLDESIVSQHKLNWGAYNLFFYKQIVSRYYLERLSNGLGEIPLLNWDVVEEGYSSGLVHYNGVPLPIRPDYYQLNQPKLLESVEQLKIYERRIREAIQLGYVIGENGDKIDLRRPEAVDVIWNIIEGNDYSPNLGYYGSILSSWKKLLGNSIVSRKMWWKGYVPLVMSSVLEIPCAEARDPAVYMIWKRIVNLYDLWVSYLPKYRVEDLAVPDVQIQKVEVDKLVTYFEQSYVNISNVLPYNVVESKVSPVSVLVQRPQLNNKVFKVRVNVKSDVSKKVVVKFFVGPKYDSKGLEIPLQENSQNFFQIDQFIYELPAGECVIKRESSSNSYMIDQWLSNSEIVSKVSNVLRGNGQWVVDVNNFYSGFPRHLMLPKGRIGGMPFQFLVFISDYKPYNGFSGSWSGASPMRAVYEPYGYPLNRPLNDMWIHKLPNLHIKEVQIYHKPTPEIVVPNAIWF
ncbi:acidic juvenile hormone-suppressible protein 1-like [Danaus plexippus]|uniref:acidic juvenile hormone-suppressible protein 1-like n=1 Tax=Danaus plexippus TaxID=13037 RepID=UPI002AB1868E|nr:acidic juvenile hormone-suppressible protein 1-like [Danaus plexippus]